MCLRTATGKSRAARLKQWKTALKKSTSTKIPAQNLYLGEYWSIIRQLPTLCTSQFDTQLHVCSAGYGLIPAHQKIAHYSATFATGHDDSVTHGAVPTDFSKTRRAWWQGMTGTRFARLVAESPDARLLVIASPDYLDAMATDLNNIQLALNNSDHLAIISSRLPPVLKKTLRTNLVPSIAKLELSKDFLGGTRSSLHARTARHLLASVTPTTFLASALRVKYQRKANRITTPLPTFNREQHTADEIKAFIRDELKKEQLGKSKRKHSHTSLLRVLRDVKWWACEQHRFAEYFREVKHETSLFPRTMSSRTQTQPPRS